MRRLITFVPFGSRFEHFEKCKTQRVECFLSVAGPTLDPPFEELSYAKRYGRQLFLLMLFYYGSA